MQVVGLLAELHDPANCVLEVLLLEVELLGGAAGQKVEEHVIHDEADELLGKQPEQVTLLGQVAVVRLPAEV